MLSRKTLIGVLSAEIRWLEGKINLLHARIYALEARLKVELKEYRKEIGRELDRQNTESKGYPDV